jgi:hypothetical protein
MILLGLHPRGYFVWAIYKVQTSSYVGERRGWVRMMSPVRPGMMEDLDGHVGMEEGRSSEAGV